MRKVHTAESMVEIAHLRNVLESAGIRCVVRNDRLAGALNEGGAVVLLFFGWITGAQLIFATYRMRTESFWRLISLTIYLEGEMVLVGAHHVQTGHVYET